MSASPNIRVRGAGVVRLRSFRDRRRGGLLFATHSLRNSGLVLPVSRGRRLVVRRVFFITGTTRTGTVRADHAQKRTGEVLFCLNGSCQLLLDDGVRKQTLRLHNPAVGILIGPHVWRKLSAFSPDCILLAFADTARYDADDYVTDYSSFVTARIKAGAMKR